jgi:hypothetical protein
VVNTRTSTAKQIVRTRGAVPSGAQLFKNSIAESTVYDQGNSLDWE